MPGPQSDWGQRGVLWVCAEHEGPARELEHLTAPEVLAILKARLPRRRWWQRRREPLGRR